MWEELQSRLSGKRAVILGVGNPLRGDDAIGPALAEQLQGYVDATVLNVGGVPENYLGTVASAQPEVVLLIDAAEMGVEPGSVAMIELDQLADMMFSTHTASLGLLARVIQSDTHADIFMLGIQPLTRAFGAPMTPPMKAAASLLKQMLISCCPVIESTSTQST